MRRAAGSVFGLAVLLSLLVHSALMVSPAAWWEALVPAEEVAFPLDAVLAEPPPPAIPATRAASIPVITPAPAPTPAPVPAPTPTPTPLLAPVFVPPASAVPDVPPPSEPPLGPAAVVAPPPQTAPAVVAPPTPTVVQPSPRPPPPRPVQRQLPEQMTLTYAVAMGEDGFKVGRSVYEWQRQGARYSLKSRTEASGLLSLFMSGQIVQESSGEIGVEGLRPDQFRIQRGDRRSDQARFDRGSQQLILNGEAQPLRAVAQDLLSFPFHLGLTLQPDQGLFVLPVTDGRKLRGYRVSSPVAETQDGRVLWRLHAWRDGDGEVDLWFDLERGGLLVRIRSLDSKRQVMTLSLEEGR